MQTMKNLYALAALGAMAVVVPAAAQSAAPLTLVTQYVLTGAPAGHFDHLTIDLAGHRLFAADEGGAVEVVSTQTGRVLHAIKSEEPHDPEYHAQDGRLYVTDGSGVLRVFDGKTYTEVASTKLWDDLDPMAFDASRNTFYTESGGGDLHQTFSHFSTIDARTMKLVNDLKIDGSTLEWMELSAAGPQIYLNNREKAQVTVVDRDTHQVVANWPIHGATLNVAMAFDQADHRLFVGCRSGQMVIFDTSKGKQLQSLPLTGGVDDMVYDPATRRVYASADGAIDVYRQASADQYERIVIKSAPLAKTSLLVPSLHRYYVAVPAAKDAPARILVYKVN